MTVIVDYRAGNLTSVKLAFAALGEPVEVTNDPAKVASCFRAWGRRGAQWRTCATSGSSTP